MEFFDIKAFISVIKTVLPSNEYSIFKDFISFIVATKTYRDQNFGKDYEDIDPSTVSKILGHKRGLYKDIVSCAKLIRSESEDFKQIEMSFSDVVLDPLGAEINKEMLVKNILEKIEADNFIKESDKEAFREAVQKKTPAIFLTRVLLYLFRNDPKPLDEEKNIETKKSNKENKEDRIENDGSDLKQNNLEIVFQNASYTYNNAYDMSVTNNNTYNINLVHHEIDKQFIENNDQKSSINESEATQKATSRNLNYINAQKTMNIIGNNKNHSEKLQKKIYPNHIDLNCYNLLVVETKDFKVGISLIRKEINEKYIECELRECIKSPAFSKEKVLKKYPSLFIPTRIYDEENRIPADQYAYIGFVDDYIENPDWEIIKWHYIAMVSLQELRIRRNHFALVDMNDSVTEMDVPHWALKNRDLFYHAKSALNIQFPMIPDVKGVVPCVHVEYKGFNEGFTLNFGYYYYGGEFNNTLTKMIKTLKIPVLTKNRIFDQKRKKFVFDRQDIRSDGEFTDILPDISFLTKFISEMPQKYIPKIQVTPRILGHNLYWQNCKLIEKGSVIDIWAPDARVEADNKDQSIGELLEAILHWLIKEKIVNKSEAIADLMYLEYQ